MQKIELQKEARKDAVEDLIKFFWDERSEEISEFHAGRMLDFMIEHIGLYIYNQAIGDAYKLMCEKVDDLYGLEKRRFR